MKLNDKNYIRLKQMEDEIVLLLSKKMSSDIRENILECKNFIGDVLSSIEENTNGENIDDLLLFLYGYDSNDIILNARSKIDESGKIVKDGS